MSYRRFSREIIEDDTKIHIEIYRCQDESGWILEVMDDENAFTVWDESFDTDQETLDAVIEIIEQDDISSFLDGEPEAMYRAFST